MASNNNLTTRAKLTKSIDLLFPPADKPESKIIKEYEELREISKELEKYFNENNLDEIKNHIELLINKYEEIKNVLNNREKINYYHHVPYKFKHTLNTLENYIRSSFDRYKSLKNTQEKKFNHNRSTFNPRPNNRNKRANGANATNKRSNSHSRPKNNKTKRKTPKLSSAQQKAANWKQYACKENYDHSKHNPQNFNAPDLLSGCFSRYAIPRRCPTKRTYFNQHLIFHSDKNRSCPDIAKEKYNAFRNCDGCKKYGQGQGGYRKNKKSRKNRKLKNKTHRRTKK
tara:strand:+ start:104 stop:958 length:855 start_codon:yes stop_codon:yes gene_type:complete